MENWFVNLARGFQEMPVVQGTAAALCTFVLEDPTTVGSGLLVAEGKMAYTTAFIGLSLGIAAGDFGLYLLGRLAQGRVVSWGMVDQAGLKAAEAWFARNMASAILASRFLPGMRLPTYVAAGILRVSPWRFLLAAVVASVVWTLFLLNLTIRVGGMALERAGTLKWPLGLGLVVFIALTQWLAAKRRKAAAGTTRKEEPVASLFEFWPPVLFYFPVALYWLWLAVRFRGMTLPTVANPSIYSGGVILESKGGILSLVPPEKRHWIAPWALFERPAESEPLDSVCAGALALLNGTGLSFPIVAKPDVGQRGAGVRPIADAGELRSYLAAFPPGTGVLFQRLVSYPHEAGVLWYLKPGEREGRIFSITLKSFPEVMGDGRRTLRELILADPRARLLKKVYFRRHRDRLGRVLGAGERLPLVFAGNHCQGAVFENGTAQATPELSRRIHEIAAAMPAFHFGRFDLRFRSLEALRRGEEFQIIEINGAGAEATHIWDRRTRLAEAYATLFEQFRILFEIGASNRERGHRPVGAVRLLRDVIVYRLQARRYPPAG
ncbi:MAG TPA: DedA family protein [Candidatus Methylomirabilis sp.]|nr:DedA family protein [Candidatus Methylomirabilis sp.]